MSQSRWDNHFLGLCKLVASMSKDKSAKVGCVIVRNDKSVATTGFNGFPRKVSEAHEDRFERPKKYLYTSHAEENAILSAAKHIVSLHGCTMYVTGPPCARCTRAIIQAGIFEVIWPEDNMFEKDLEVAERWKEDFEASFEMMDEAGVNYLRIKGV